MSDQFELSWRTTFTRNKAVLAALLSEINEDEFDNQGTLLVNVPFLELRDLSEEFYSTRNIILKFSYPKSKDGFYFENFIGLYEAGQSHVGVFVIKDKTRHWISDIANIVATLREAMDFWNTDGNFDEREREIACEESRRAQEEAALEYMEEEAEEDAEIFWQDMHDAGYDDDDF